MYDEAGIVGKWPMMIQPLRMISWKAIEYEKEFKDDNNIKGMDGWIEE
jgi:hypothetical protein